MVLNNKQVAEFAFDLQVGLEGADVPEFDSTRVIGNAAILAVNLRGLGEVQYGTLRLVAASYFGIRSDVLDGVLRTLAELELVNLITTGGTIKTIIPRVPHFEDVYQKVGELLVHRPLNEIEQVTVNVLDRLCVHPENQDSLRSKLGADLVPFKATIEIGTASGLIVDKRARGRNILASPLYFSGNLDGLIDIAARGETPALHRILTTVSKYQGMPLSLMLGQMRIGTNSITPDEGRLVQALAQEGIIKPPSIKRPNASEEQFIFTPAPGKARLSAANREIYEKAMALAAAVRKGQLLPEAYQIRYPDALLRVLEERKFINASSEAAVQYQNLPVIGLGRLEDTGFGRFRFHLIDVPENVEAVRLARTLLSGNQPGDLEADRRAQLYLSKDETYVKSQLASASLRRDPKTAVLSAQAKAEVDQYMLLL